MLLQKMLIINGVTHVPTERYLLWLLHSAFTGSIRKNTRGRTDLKCVQSSTFLHGKEEF